jgi:N-acetyl-gamma-glutamyl-phosphate reductase
MPASSPIPAAIRPASSRCSRRWCARAAAGGLALCGACRVGLFGGGKALIARFEDDTDIAWRGYGLAFGHKHVPEMTAYAGLSVAPLFSPAVVPALRGMVVEVPLSLEALPGVGIGKGEALYDALAASYAGSPIVSVSLGAPAEGES